MWTDRPVVPVKARTQSIVPDDGPDAFRDNEFSKNIVATRLQKLNGERFWRTAKEYMPKVTGCDDRTSVDDKSRRGMSQANVKKGSSFVV